MGHDKRRLSLGGETLLQRNLAFLRGIFPVVALSVRDAAQAPADLPAGRGGRPRRRHRLAAGRHRLRAHAVRRAVLRPRHRRRVPAGRRGRARAARVSRRRRGHPGRRRPLGAAARRVRSRLPAAHRVAARRRGAQHPRPLPAGARCAGSRSTTRRRSSTSTRRATGPRPGASPARRRTRPPRPGADGSGPLVLGVVGRSGSGKTTLIERLIPELTRRGLSVATVKRVARFDIDTPGKDSWRHSQAGAQAYAVASASQFAFVAELPGEPSLADHRRPLLRRLRRGRVRGLPPRDALGRRGVPPRRGPRRPAARGPRHARPRHGRGPAAPAPLRARRRAGARRLPRAAARARRASARTDRSGDAPAGLARGRRPALPLRAPPRLAPPRTAVLRSCASDSKPFALRQTACYGRRAVPRKDRGAANDLAVVGRGGNAPTSPCLERSKGHDATLDPAGSGRRRRAAAGGRAGGLTGSPGPSRRARSLLARCVAVARGESLSVPRPAARRPATTRPPCTCSPPRRSTRRSRRSAPTSSRPTRA